jgi:hypothetical protein
MAINEHEGYKAVAPHFGRIWESLTGGFKTHVEDPLRLSYDTSTRASTANNLMFGELIANFDGVPSVRPVTDRKNNLKYLCIQDRVLLWLKKVTIGRYTSNYPTDLAIDRLDGQMTFDEIPQASIVTLGYLPDAEENSIARISFSPPFRSLHPEWYFDLVPVGNVTQMGQRERRTRGQKFIVVRGNAQEGFGQ